MLSSRASGTACTPWTCVLKIPISWCICAAASCHCWATFKTACWTACWNCSRETTNYWSLCQWSALQSVLLLLLHMCLHHPCACTGATVSRCPTVSTTVHRRLRTPLPWLHNMSDCVFSWSTLRWQQIVMMGQCVPQRSERETLYRHTSEEINKMASLIKRIVKKRLVLSDGSRNFRKLCSVWWEHLVLHGYVCIHWIAKYCTTNAYRWLFWDSHSSLRTLWSAVVKSPELSGSKYWVTNALLQRTLVMLVLFQTAQFRSFGKWVKILLLAWSSWSDAKKLENNAKTENYVPLARNHFAWKFQIWFTRSACGCIRWFWHSFVNKIFCEILQPLWRILRTDSHCWIDVHILVFCIFGVVQLVSQCSTACTSMLYGCWIWCGNLLLLSPALTMLGMDLQSTWKSRSTRSVRNFQFCIVFSTVFYIKDFWFLVP